MTRDPDSPGTAGAGLARRVAAGAVRGAAAGLAAALARGRAGLARAWHRRPPLPRATAIAFAVGAAALGAHGILFQAGLPARLPSRLDWTAARVLLERDARPGDAVALAPAWAERAREVLPPGLPVLARTGRGEDLPGVRRVWLLSLSRAPGYDWSTEVALVSRAARSTPAQRLGALEVTRHELARPTLPLAFLPDRLAQAEVSLGGAPCAADGAAFVCEPAGLRVERTVREVDGVPRPCLSVSLDAPPGAPLALAFPGVPLARAVRGHAGVAGGRGHTPGATVRIAVLVDGEEAGAVEVAGGGFEPFEIDTAHLPPGFHVVTLVLTSPGAPGTLCLDAETLP